MQVISLTLTLKKLWTNWKSTPFLGPIRELKSQGKMEKPWKNREYRESQLRSAFLDQKPWAGGSINRKKYLNYWKIVEAWMWTSTRVRNTLVHGLGRGVFLWILSAGKPESLIMENQEKYLHVSSRGREK